MSPPLPFPRPGAGSPAAYLRVYEPLVAFPLEERDAWANYAARAGTRSNRLVAEHRMALAGVLSVPPQPVPSDEVPEAFVLVTDDTTYVCPLQTRLRSWVALGQFRDGLPDALLHAFVPPAALARVESDHERWGADQVGSALRILTATWSVPLQWLVPFAPSDQVSERSGERSEPTCVVHRTRMSAARRRVARALRTVRESLGEIDAVEELTDLGLWLEEWHPRAWVELDYAGLSRIAGIDGGSDTSVEDVTAALAALAAGDEETAAQRYRSVVERWIAVAAFEHAN